MFKGWFGWAEIGYSDPDLYSMTCGVCRNIFVGKPATTGDGIRCPHCGADGYGTYDTSGDYMIEWYEGESHS